MVNRCGNERRAGFLKANSSTAVGRRKSKQTGRSLLHAFMHEYEPSRWTSNEPRDEERRME
jgi:hypothetical protein